MAKETDRLHTPIKQVDIEAWLVRLRCFLSRSRKKIRPRGKQSRARPRQSAQAEDAEEKLLQNQMRTWLSGLDQRLADSEQWGEIRPAVVITTSPVGLRACEKVAGEPAFVTLCESCCHLTEYEYRYWCKEEPDLNFQFHINYWAWIKTSVPSARLHEFRRYPIAGNNEYWLLRHGANGLGEQDYADCQVLAWNGASTKVLVEHFHEGVPSV